ncbi:MAG: hydrolase [Oscillospiraceae bacterium]|jgi:hypothetical protein|nr:hydrolase [Oscillospiraceae bacterium]
MFELSVDNKRRVFSPLTRGDVLCESFYRGRCGKLSFGAVGGGAGEDFEIREGDSVGLKANGTGLFFGIVFSKKTYGDGVVSLTAYDQLRYLKNRDTYVYGGKKASDVVKMIAGDYLLRTGEISETEYVIPSRVEDNATLLDIIENALDLEKEHKGKRYALFDDFGKLSLKSEAEMFSRVVVDDCSAADFRCFSSADNRFNRVKLFRADKKTGKREIFVAENEKSVESLGVLQYYAKIGDGENGGEKARSILALRDRTEQTLYIENALGDAGVRGGSSVTVRVRGFDETARVRKCVHKLSGRGHFMDLELEMFYV